MPIQDDITNRLKQQEKLLLSIRERSEKLNKNCDTNNNFQYERARFIGMLEIAKMLDVDTAEFHWIYNT